MQNGESRPSPESLLAKLKAEEQPRLRVYLGAAPGVGKTYQMLEDAQQLIRQGVDVVVAVIETHRRADTAALIGDLEQVPLRGIAYRGVTLKELDLAAVIARKPAIAIVDELAHTNVPGSKNHKRYEDVLELLSHGISVITAVNIQHIESLNDVVAQVTGVRVRETIPDHVIRRADEVVNVDVSVDTLRTRLRQGKIYGVEKIEQSLNNFFRKGNLTALRELALRQLAEDQDVKARKYRAQEGLEQATLPERVMVCMASRGSAKKLLRTGSRIAGRLADDWYAVYVETPREEPGRIDPQDFVALQENIRFAEGLGARVVKLKGSNVADALIEFARRECITHVIFGQSARSRWNILLHGSIINRFLNEVREATVQVVPMDRPAASTTRAQNGGGSDE
ncbi:MAG: universal stress protein [Acidobacteria bacterium]|nr:universal stress protein [Acidobacteriota bacterium]MBI3421775.1 universal stress protein [Acidobacteriota bacterium]